MLRSCGNCQYFIRYSPETKPEDVMPRLGERGEATVTQYGFCRRYPPVPLYRPNEEPHLVSSPASTGEDHWCGEWYAA